MPEALTFRAWGVGIRVEADRSEPLAWLRARLGALLPRGVEELGAASADHLFTVETDPSGALNLTLDGQPLGGNPSFEVALAYLATRIKIVVGEHATSHVFVHAGVVALGDGALLLPGPSNTGKTTLVRELVRRGALYYSDDFAPLDREGRVWPFPKSLSIREPGGELRQVEHPVEALGGFAGTAPIRVDSIVLTHYDPAADWKPRRIERSEAILELIAHTLPMHVSPALSLAVLGRVVAGAKVWKSPRNECRDVVDWIFGTPGRDRGEP